MQKQSLIAELAREIVEMTHDGSGVHSKSSKRVAELLNNTLRLSKSNHSGGLNQLYGLYDLIHRCVDRDSVVLEVGSFEGKSTELFALHAKRVYSVDPYLPYPEISTADLREAEEAFIRMQGGYANIEKIRRTSLDAAALFADGTLDVVYIDGDHSYEAVKQDIAVWRTKVRRGGYIGGHDYGQFETVNKPYVWGMEQVRRAVEESFPNRSIETFNDASWLVKLD